MNLQEKCEEEKSQPTLLSKFTDPVTSIIELVVLILEKFGINIPYSAKTEIGIIILLTTIYLTGDLFKLQITIPMIIFGVLVIYTIVDILSMNFQKISRFVRGTSRAENIIEKIKAGTLAYPSKEISLSTFDAESLDKLLIELSDQGLLTYDIQNVLINTQYFYPKNLRTLFNNDSKINFHEDIILKILSSNKIRNSLTENQIQNIIDKYKNNNKIMSALLLNQPLSLRMIKTSKEETLKTIFLSCSKYLEHPFLIDRYFYVIEFILNLSFTSIFFLIFAAIIVAAIQNKTQTSPDSLVFSIIVSVIFMMGILLNLHSFVRKNFIKYINNKKLTYVIGSLH